jgi:hypothetical protein
MQRGWLFHAPFHGNYGCGELQAGMSESGRFCATRVASFLLCFLAFVTTARAQTPATSAAARGPAPQAPATTLKPIPIKPPPGIGNLEPIYMLHSFQLCCNFMIPGIISPGSPTSGGPNWPAAINSNLVPAATNGVRFYITPLPASELPSPGAPGRPPAGGTWPQSGVSVPLYVNFFTRQASLDGVTACCAISTSSGAPIIDTEVIYLDMLPIGVVYMPPGDPRATGSFMPQQKYTTQNANQTSTTKVTNSVIGDTGGFSLGAPGVSLTGSYGTSSQDQSTNLQQQIISFLSGASAVGPGGYPGQADTIEVIVNPTFDVTYLAAYSYSNQIPPIPASPVVLNISQHTPKRGEPGGPTDTSSTTQWEACNFTPQQLQSGGPAATCLQFILPVPNQGVLPVNPVTGTLGPLPPASTLEQRALQLDPMVPPTNVLLPGGGVKPLPGFPGIQGSPASAPPSVLSNPRFLPLGLDGENPQAYPWHYCEDPAPTPFSAILTSLNSTQFTTTTKTTGAVNFTLNAVQLGTALLGSVSGTGEGSGSGSGSGSAGGGGSSGYTASVSFGTSWELDTSISTTLQKTLTLTSQGNFGSGMTPQLYSAAAPGNPSNEWTANTTYPNTGSAIGNFVLPTIDNTYVYEVKTGGVSGTTEPTWCTTAGCTVKDGTVVWVLFSNTCDALPWFTTYTYYDEASNTVLFWTTPEPTGTVLVTGSAQSTQLAGLRVVFTQGNGASSGTVFTGSKGQFSVKLPPGDYTYQILDSTGHLLTPTPVPVNVPANQTLPVRLPTITLSGIR